MQEHRSDTKRTRMQAQHSKGVQEQHSSSGGKHTQLQQLCSHGRRAAV
jgi:hypothetical protein